MLYFVRKSETSPSLVTRLMFKIQLRENGVLSFFYPICKSVVNVGVSWISETTQVRDLPDQ